MPPDLLPKSLSKNPCFFSQKILRSLLRSASLLAIMLNFYHFPLDQEIKARSPILENQANHWNENPTLYYQPFLRIWVLLFLVPTLCREQENKNINMDYHVHLHRFA